MLTLIVVLLAVAVVVLVASTTLLTRGRRRPPEPLPRHRKRRDPYSPLHVSGLPVERWLTDEDRTP